jgi:D-glycero-alpha-D-manno-heptose-7-phosphate kinase
MFISRTPFRVSLFGGGTDLPCFYSNEPGAVISMTINKYVFITVSRRFDDSLRLSYSQTEIVNRLDEVRHPLFREAMRYVGVTSGVEVTSIADVPGGTGLGSSSSFTVALLHALYAHGGCYRTARELAESACHIEMDILSEPIGKQDQYAAAFGGLRRYQFNPDGSVFVDPVICSDQVKRDLLDRLLFFYLGGSRDARTVLKKQCDASASKIAQLRKIRGFVDDCWRILVNKGDLRILGELMHCSWIYKRALADNVSSTRIDDLYERGRKAGAMGGKVLGAGGNGFLMFFCEPDLHNAVRGELKELREVEFGLEPEGSKIIYVGN